MIIKLKKCISEVNKLKKIFSGSEIVLEGSLRGALSLKNPSVTVERSGLDLAEYNYMEIPDLGRKYWMTANPLAADLWELNGVRDPLGSFEESILKSRGMIDRRSRSFNAYIGDGSITEESRSLTTVHHFKDPDNAAYDVDADGFVYINPANWEYILIVGGPGAAPTP